MRVFGYHQSNLDHTLFLKIKLDKITTIIMHIDYIGITVIDPQEEKIYIVTCSENLI